MNTSSANDEDLGILGKPKASLKEAIEAAKRFVIKLQAYGAAKKVKITNDLGTLSSGSRRG